MSGRELDKARTRTRKMRRSRAPRKQTAGRKARKQPARSRGLSTQLAASSRLRSLKHASPASRQSAYGWWLNESSENFSRSETKLSKMKSTFFDVTPQDKDRKSGARPKSPAEPHRLRTWQMLYCGGAQPVVDSLTEISKTYGIKLRVEKFDW